ncbi:hypothetical protein GQ53DRAFT_230232 [Thozetella sp. PMI_491]|nr:hypothetical protein GQ53DRAFT_230232 [Thozetella sp. PMI_491]
MAFSMRRKASHYMRRKDLALEKQNSKAQIEATCPICQEPIGTKNPEGIVEGWSVLPCGHRFGSYCIKHYLRIVATERPTCPVCRQNVYHSCYHPVLPAVLKPTARGGPKVDEIIEAAPYILPEVECTECAYCLDRKTAAPASHLGRLARLRSAVSFLRIPRFKLRRPPWPRRPTQNQDTDSDSSSESDEEAASPPPLMDDGIPTPWIDPFPRPRDPEWEEWWVTKEPRGA